LAHRSAGRHRARAQKTADTRKNSNFFVGTLPA
jgi:hypothetical protein